MPEEREQGSDPQVETAYYPGCSLHGTAREYDQSVRETGDLLGVRLVELPDWNCCGASSAHMTDDRLALDLAVRNLRIARQVNQELLVPCAACFHRLKAAQKALRESGDSRDLEGLEIRVVHLHEWLCGRETLGKIRLARRHSLQGLKLAAYYGCLVTRPPAVTGSREPENPTGLDQLLRVLGAEPRRWSTRPSAAAAV